MASESSHGRLILILVVMTCVCGHRSDSTQKSVTQEGDVILQGLFPITFRDGSECDRLYKDGVMWAMAMLFAIDSINNSTILNNITLGYKLDNTCHHIPTAMHHAIEIVAKYRPNSICYPQKEYCEKRKSETKVSAVIGPAMSWIAIPIASLLGLYDIPQISYAATSRILSDKTRYNSFLRTVPSDEYQAKAMAKFVHSFGWNYVFIIATDDDYGKMGAATFKTTAKSLNVCIASDEYIPFKSDMADEYLHNTLITLKNSERAKVVIIFSYASQGEILLKEAEKLNITDRTWITSDAWSSSVTSFNLSQKLLEGIITFSIRSKRVEQFVDYVNGLQVKDAQYIPWFLRYMESVLDCTSSNLTQGSKRPCDPSETLPPHHHIANEAIANVIDAVNATAIALKAAFSCTSSKPCRDPNLPLTSFELLQYIKNSSFLGSDNAYVEFNSNGDRTSSGYTITNVQIQNGKLVYVEVGCWSQIEGKTYFKVNETLIKWNNGQRPRSNCFRVCQPGERVVGQTKCCWNCQKCEKGTYSSSAGALSCTECNDTHYTSPQRTTCIAREIVYLSLQDPAGMSILTVSLLGIVVTTIIAGIFVQHRTTPIIASSTVFHLVMFFIILYMSFIFAMLFTINKPSDTTCIIIESMYELLIMMFSSFLLSKTRIINKSVRSAVSRLKHMRPEWSHIIVTMSLMTLQLILVTLRQCITPSHIHFVNQENKTRLLQCKQVFSSLRVLAIAAPSTILIIATIISFRERNVPDNFNEAKFISFTTILLCIIFISFTSTYRYVAGISRILVMTFTAFVTAFSGMGCLFIPKLYIIFVRPERNCSPPEHTSSDSNGVSDNQDTSARTSVASDGPFPDLNYNLKSVARKKSNFLEVQNSANHGTSFINHGACAESRDESFKNECDNVSDSANHVPRKEPTNQLQGKQVNIRKKSKSHVTFELSTVPETVEDSSGCATVEDSIGCAPTMQEHYSNLGCSDNDVETSYSHALDTRNTPRAFTVI